MAAESFGAGRRAGHSPWDGAGRGRRGWRAVDVVDVAKGVGLLDGDHSIDQRALRAFNVVLAGQVAVGLDRDPLSEMFRPFSFRLWSQSALGIFKHTRGRAKGGGRGRITEFVASGA